MLIKGLALSAGISQGRAYVIACADHAAGPQRSIEESEIPAELSRFARALEQAERELGALELSVGRELGTREAAIFSAQRLLIGDAAFRDQVTAIVRDKRVNVEAAIAEVVERFTRAFDKISDPYLRERATDIRDIGRRVLDALLADGAERGAIPEGAVLVAEELLPSAAARLELHQVRGFVTERGGRFSHTAILARSLGTPAVTGIAGVAERIRTGDRVIVDGVSGVVFVNPDHAIEREYDRLAREIESAQAALRSLVDVPSTTRDGCRIALLATVSKFADTESALLCNPDGIGLYRTEFGFAIRGALPTEDEQYEFLERAAARFHPRRVVLRLLDLGGDKFLPYLPLPRARNPSLAQRGIRLLLQHQDILRTQLRAFLRVSGKHPISILLPMVGGVDDVRAVRAVVAAVQRELTADGHPVDNSTPIGAMIEVPAAALLARDLAHHVDFFSLGTNDLVQYLLAADREDETVTSYYQPLHPAVLRLIRSIAEVAEQTGREVTICGEMAGDARYTALLLGLGLRSFSIAPGELLAVKRALRAVTLADAEALARRVLALSSAAEIETLVSSQTTGAPDEAPMKVTPLLIAQ